MLPFATRNRRVLSGQPDSSDLDAGEMISNIRKSTFNMRRIPLTAKCFFLLFCVLCLYIYGSLYLAWGQNRLTKEEFLETDKCPACYGQSLCFELFDDQFELSGMSKYHIFDVVNVRNVHFGFHKHKEEEKIVLKKLAFNNEIQYVDAKLCQDSDRNPGCDLARTMVVTNIAKDIHRTGLEPRHLKDASFMFLCPTYKLIDKVLASYKEAQRRHGDVSLDDKLQLLYTAKINSEPLLLQTFNASEGWPFPQYYGACGRYIAVEYGGKTLGEFYDAPWEKRADLAYQMLLMAKRLTEDPEWNLYWTDLAYDNFAVDPSGKLMVIDAENIMVVDKEAVKLANKESWDVFSEAHFDECKTKHEDYGNCLSFDTDELCTHYETDHNYYAACRNMLSKYASEEHSGRVGGLLHDMPNFAKDDWDLEHLLNECSRPSQPQGRRKILPRLIDALNNLRNVKVKDTGDRGKRLHH